MKRVELSLKELKRILELMENFNSKSVEIETDTSNGIGKLVYAHYYITLADIPGKYVVEITNENDW
jgi:hypothetical protein